MNENLQASSPSVALQKKHSRERDFRIDFSRGVALLFVFIDHNNFVWLRKLTIQQISFLDAADCFIFLSGYSAALAYLRLLRAEGFRAVLNKAWRRVGELYLANLILFAVVAATVVLLASYGYREPGWFTAPFLNSLPKNALNVLWLGAAPSYLDILQLYMVFLTLTPFALYGLERRPFLTVAVAFSLYASTLLLHAFDLDRQAPVKVWFFNPFAWQIVFFLGLWTGHSGVLQRKSERPLWLLAAAFIGLLLIALYRNSNTGIVSRFMEMMGDPGLLRRPSFQGPFPLTEKHNAEPFRLVNLGLWIILIAHIPPAAQFFRSGLAKVLVTCGQSSLIVYCTGVVLSYAIIILSYSNGSNRIRELILTAVGVAILVVVATVWRSRRRSPQVESVGQPVLPQD